MNWIYEKKPISDHQPDTYKVKLKSKFSAAASRVCDILLHINHLISLKKRRATSFAFDDDQNDMQYVLWDKIMCVGSDLMQNKGNKVSERVFFLFNQVSINFLQCGAVAVRGGTTTSAWYADSLQSILTAHFFLLIAVFQSMRRTLLKLTKLYCRYYIKNRKNKLAISW